MKSQEQQILEYLQAGNSLTPILALNLFGCFRLGARCFDLKQQGYPVRSEMVKGENGKHFARYSLTEGPKYPVFGDLAQPEVPIAPKTARATHLEDNPPCQLFERKGQLVFL